MVELFANSGDPDQMLHSGASDLGLHCLPITLLGAPDHNSLTGSCQENSCQENKRQILSIEHLDN